MEKKYQVVTEAIQDWIDSGKYQPNQKLPTELKLMELFKVSRHTIRKSLSDLEVRGLVYRIQGGGTFVADKKRKAAATARDAHTVAILTTHINDYIFPAIISGIESELTAQSISMMLSSTQNNTHLEQHNLNKILNSNIDGLIVEPTKSAFEIKNLPLYQELYAEHVPIITLNAKIKGLDVPYFVMDDFEGGRIATKYLLDKGHQNILGVFKTDDQQGIDRMNGFNYAIQQSQIPSLNRSLMFQSGDAKANLGMRLREIFELPDRPTALICYNDQIAVTAFNLALSMGIKVPEQLSIIGFDNSTLAHSFGINLTSVNHPKVQMGQDAAELMIRMLKDPNKDFRASSQTYQPEIIAGDSVVEI